MAGLFDVLGDGVGDELKNDILQFKGLDVTGDDVDHLLADGTDLGGLGIAGLLNLMGPLAGETDAEDSQQIAVGGAHIHVGLDQSLPLLDHRSELISGKVHAVEVGQNVSALNFFGDQTELFVGNLVVLQVGERNLKDSA